MSRVSFARLARALLLTMAAIASVVTTVWVLAGIVETMHGQPMAPWLLARASGFTSYLLMMLLVAFGLLMSHPGSVRLRRPQPLTRLRIHVALAGFTLAFTVLHIVVLATDPWAKVGWRGALLPMAAQYRPIPVTLGVVAVWSALLAGVTAALAGRMAGRIWWPIHKLAALAFVLVWAHGFLAGSDTPAMVPFYLATGGSLLVLAVSRYAARTPADELEDMLREHLPAPAKQGSR